MKHRLSHLGISRMKSTLIPSKKVCNFGFYDRLMAREKGIVSRFSLLTLF